MLKIDSKNTNYNGSSNTTEGQQVAYLTASLFDNNCTVNITIDNLDLYKSNKVLVQTDIQSFMDAFLDEE